VKTIMERHGLSWTMNYTAQHEHALMHEPLFQLRKGEHVVVTMLNRTEFRSTPCTCTGTFSRVVASTARPVAERVWRDTAMMAPHAEMDIAFVRRQRRRMDVPLPHPRPRRRRDDGDGRAWTVNHQ
jgi:FtsP/CotA-like multicopper oxidase with cupredoxin domain